MADTTQRRAELRSRKPLDPPGRAMSRLSDRPGLMRQVGIPLITPLIMALALWSSAGPAAAHLRVTSPESRHEQLKQGPCGAGADDPRGGVVHTFQPGQTITVVWDEYIDHPGHFRISFDADGQDDFVDPASFTDVSGGPAVLLDDIPDRKGGGEYSQSVTLPDVECDNCTLQVIQVMTDKAPYGDGNDLYYQCIDLVLSRAATGDATSADLSEAEGCGCSAPASAPAGVLVLLLLGLRRRSRRV